MILQIFQKEGDEYWSDDDDVALNASASPAESASQNKSTFSSLINYLFFSLIVWQLTFSVSDATVIMMVVILKKFISLLSKVMKSAELKKVEECSRLCAKSPNKMNKLFVIIGEVKDKYQMTF